MITARERLVAAGIRFEERRQDAEAVASDPAMSPETKFFASHREFVSEIELLIAAQRVLQGALH